MMHTRTSSLLVAATVLIATAGCSDGDESSGDESSSIRVMTWGGPEDIASIEEAAAGFIEANPDIEVTFETGECAADYAACKLLIAGDNMPDVIVPGSWNYFELVQDGVLADLTPFIEETGYVLEDLTPTITSALTADDGSIYGLPMGYNVQSLYFNEEMFTAAGLAPPPADGSYTYEDMRGWAKTLTLDVNGNNADSPEFDPENVVQWGYANLAVSPDYLQSTFPLLWAHGGGILGGADGTDCLIDSDESIQALQLLQDMMWTDHSTITPQLYQEEPGYLRWVNGSVAMQQGSHEQVFLVAEQNPGMAFDMAALPAGPEGNATLMQIHAWSIYEGSESQDAAWSFVDHMTTEGSGKQMGLIPAYQDVAQGEDFALAEGEPEHLVQAQLEPVEWPLAATNVDPDVLLSAIGTQDGIAPAIADIMANRQSAGDALSGICESVVDPLIERQVQ